MSILTEAFKNIINLPRYTKRIIAILTDISFCELACVVPIALIILILGILLDAMIFFMILF